MTVQLNGRIIVLGFIIVTSHEKKGKIMAMVAAGNGTGFFVVVTLIDRNEDVTTKEYELDVADFAEALGAQLEIEGDLALVSDALIVGSSLAQRRVNDAIVVPIVGEVQTKARIIVRLDGGNEKATIDIPAPKETMFLTLSGKGNKVVDLENASIIDFLANYLPAGNVFLSDGEKLGEALEGRKVSVSSGFRS